MATKCVALARFVAYIRAVWQCGRLQCCSVASCTMRRRNLKLNNGGARLDHKHNQAWLGLGRLAAAAAERANDAANLTKVRGKHLEQSNQSVI